MSDDEHRDRPRRNLVWLEPVLYKTGDRPPNPLRDQLIHDASGPVLRWTGDEWVDDLPEWLLLQYTHDRDPARPPAEVSRHEQARWEVWESGQRFRNAPPGSDDAKVAERTLRRMARRYSGGRGWHESWAM